MAGWKADRTAGPMVEYSVGHWGQKKVAHSVAQMARRLADQKVALLVALRADRSEHWRAARMAALTEYLKVDLWAKLMAVQRVALLDLPRVARMVVTTVGQKAACSVHLRVAYLEQTRAAQTAAL